MTTTKDRTAFADALDEAKSIVEGAKAEDRDLTTEEKSEVDALVAKAEEAQARIDSAGTDDTLTARLAALMGGADTKSDKAGEAEEAKSLGSAFADSPAYKAWLATTMIDGQVPDSVKNFRTPTVQVGRKFLNTATIGGSFDSVDRRGVMVSEPWPRGLETLLALLSTGSTSSAVINYAVEDWTSAADFVAEATSLSTGLKPQSDVTYTPATVPVGTVAHWVAATKQALADVGQLRALIDNGLRRGVLVKIVQSILTGDGVAPEWFGLNNLATIPAQAYATSPLVTVKNSLAAIEGAGFDANAIVMNSADWAAIDQATPVVVTDPLQNRPKNIGGVTVISTALQPVGFAMVGDFKQAWLLDREQAAVTATDSHADFFIRNLVAILGEWRGAFFVTAPAAFRKADLTP